MTFYTIYKATAEAVEVFSDQNDDWYRAPLMGKIITQKNDVLETQTVFGFTCT